MLSCFVILASSTSFTASPTNKPSVSDRGCNFGGLCLSSPTRSAGLGSLPSPSYKTDSELHQVLTEPKGFAQYNSTFMQKQTRRRSDATVVGPPSRFSDKPAHDLSTIARIITMYEQIRIRTGTRHYKVGKEGRKEGRNERTMRANERTDEQSERTNEQSDRPSERSEMKRAAAIPFFVSGHGSCPPISLPAPILN